MTVPVTKGAEDRKPGGRRREIRLDVFRGLALIFIFLDHIPSNALNWLTIRNFGFSDASEAFVFIAGYSAVLAYGRRIDDLGVPFVTARIYKRCWQLYVAQLLLFMVFTAQVAYTAATFNNPMYSEEMGIVRFFDEPHVTLLEAMLLRFRPTNMDILPLYIVLLLLFPFILLGLRRWPAGMAVLSLTAYGAANLFGWNLSTWPEGAWLFNPLAWQALFVAGAAAGLAHGRDWLRPWRRTALWLALLYLAFAFLIVLTWHSAVLESYVPTVVGTILYPIDKTNLSPSRLLHFLALAYVAVRLIPGDAPLLSWAVWRPVIRCGQHPLEIFCLGVFLSFAGHMLLVEWSGSLWAQTAVSLAGIGVMVAAAYYLSWYRAMEKAVSAGRTAKGEGGRA
ncbi:MAG: OpgC domain-containing protein [Telmatospirillum sp.]|nr:OpgC domain-containing protein [Telmatospirillum sp.]